MMYYVQAPQIGGDVTMERTVSGNSPDPGVVQPYCEATALSPFVLPEAHPDQVYEGMLKRVRFLAATLNQRGSARLTTLSNQVKLSRCYLLKVLRSLFFSIVGGQNAQDAQRQVPIG